MVGTGTTMSKSRSNKSIQKDPKSGPGARLINMGRVQIAISKDKYIPKTKAGRKKERDIAAGGAKNLMAGYEKRAKAKAKKK